MGARPVQREQKPPRVPIARVLLDGKWVPATPANVAAATRAALAKRGNGRRTSTERTTR